MSETKTRNQLVPTLLIGDTTRLLCRFFKDASANIKRIFRQVYFQTKFPDTPVSHWKTIHKLLKIFRAFSGVISNNKKTIMRHLSTREKLTEICARIQISLTNIWTCLCSKWVWLRHRQTLLQLWCICIQMKQLRLKSFTVHIM